MKYLLSMVTGATLFNMGWLSAVEAQTPAPATSEQPVTSEQTVAGQTLDEIIVTTRRKEESLLDVPVTVDVVPADEVQKLDILQFSDVASVVPGLSFANNGVALRGVAFNQLVPGTPNVQLYFNDAAVPPTLLSGQSLFDIGQFEVSRGPQGTLRGTSAPSGNVNLTSRLPSLTDVGGYADVTGSSLDLINAQFAIGIPLISDKLAIRLATMVQNQEGTGGEIPGGSLIDSVNNPARAYGNVWGARATVLFDPIDTLQMSMVYQREDIRSRTYPQVESLGFVDHAVPLSNPVITPNELLSSIDGPSTSDMALNLASGHLDWEFLGQKLSYVGAYFLYAPTSAATPNVSSLDQANVFPGSAITEDLAVTETQWSHEIRLASEERLLGIFDYTVGGYYSRQPATAIVTEPTVIAAQLPSGLTPVATAVTAIDSVNTVREASVFGNVTIHLGDSNEISGGVRHIHQSTTSFLGFGSIILQNNVVRGASPNIYNITASHHFNQDLMIYAATGTSFRKGPLATTNFPPVTPNEIAFTQLKDETSQNYELGLKGVAFDKRLSFYVDGYYQKYKNFDYTGSPVYYANEVFVNGTPELTPATFAFSASVPVQVWGIEANASAQITPSFSILGNLAYAHAYIVNGRIACNPPGALPPTVAQIQAAAAGDNVASCLINYPVSEVPPLNASIQGQYDRPINDSLVGYVRGLVTGQSRNPTDRANPYDVVPPFATVNLYLGISDPHSNWAAELYAKNLFGTDRVTTYGSAPLDTSYLVLAGKVPTGALTTSNYITANTIPPREFGFHVHYAFGSR